MRNLYFLTLIFFFFALPFGKSQKYSNEFLSIGVGAAAHARGLAVSAQVDDVTAGYWNPAGLCSLIGEEKLQISAMHAEWFAGIGKFDYLSLSLPMSNSERRIGLSLIRFGIDGIPNTLSLYEADGTVNYNNIVEFSAADYAIIGSYAQYLQIGERKLRVGGNVKVIPRVIGTFARSWGFGLDIGLQYQAGAWQFGFTGRDITNTFNAWKVSFTDAEKEVLLATGNELPALSSLELTRPSMQVGVARKFEFSDKLSLSAEMDWFITTDGKRNTLLSGKPLSLDPALGLELSYHSFLFLRGGINRFQREFKPDGTEFLSLRPAIGVGLQMGSFLLDYAYTDLGDSQNRYSHIISLRIDMKPKK